MLVGQLMARESLTQVHKVLYPVATVFIELHRFSNLCVVNVHS